MREKWSEMMSKLTYLGNQLLLCLGDPEQIIDIALSRQLPDHCHVLRGGDRGAEMCVGWIWKGFART